MTSEEAQQILLGNGADPDEVRDYLDASEDFGDEGFADTQAELIEDYNLYIATLYSDD